MNRNNMVSCGNEMRANQSQVERLQAQIEQFKLSPTKMYLSDAASHLKLCVSCAPFATEHCGLANTSLRDAENSL